MVELPDYWAKYSTRVPLDPMDADWDAAEEYEIALSKQNWTAPHGGGTVTKATLQVMYSRGHVAFRVRWANDSAERSVSQLRHRDSCAIAFPALEGDPPPINMGAPGNPMVIWQWKPDWEDRAGAEAAFDKEYPSYSDFINPVETELWENVGDVPEEDGIANVLVTEGMGSVTRTSDPGLEIKSHHTGTEWVVVFRHTIPINYPPLAPGVWRSVNVAVWDGAAGDTGARKSLSFEWHKVGLAALDTPEKETLRFLSPEAAMGVGAVAVAGLAGVIAWAIKRRNARMAEATKGGRFVSERSRDADEVGAEE